MPQRGARDTRTLLLTATADLIAENPGVEISLRTVCDQVGVKLPTLYHFFGSKAGLLEAVVDHGFDTYITAKKAHESSDDPIQDLRDGWDNHVAFGVDNPGFYALMYGRVRPGYRPESAVVADELLLGLTRAAADRGLLVVPAQLAASTFLATSIGVTLQLITTPTSDEGLSRFACEAVISAITRDAAP